MLFSRTIPLIRYELTDRIRLATHACACPLRFALVDSIEGRTDDVLVLRSPDKGTFSVHPVVFHQVLDLLDAGGWQVRQHDDALDVLVMKPGPAFDPIATERAVHQALAKAGAELLGIHVTPVDSIPAGAGGKRPLIVAQHRSPAKS
ncbi:hypothetical protein [Mycolicibacterium chlorophenolicum]|uniref:Uncharacterized protein n=1 Tax=Mycolicibacterium chlorophenolicum TaxID=37916 RepID=A0A0J6VP68_9MYCO|nr:hypothetical protein [Mycolicibacterium chlorophenolicum]KMO71297.1 hypothetical protein MCHLDSM_04612 [Mycolicibacterium chlorophenolicum]